MVVRGGYDGLWRGGGWFVIVFYCMFHLKKMGSECRVSVRVHSVLGCTGSCGNTSRKQLKKKK